MDNSLIVEGLNIAELSDDELSERLQKLGFEPGPVLASTRSVYQRKLARLMRNETFEEVEETYDEEVKPSPVLNSTLLDYSTSSSPSYSSSPGFSVDDLRRRPLNHYEDKMYSNDPPILTPHKPWSPNDIVTQVEPPPGEMEKPLISTTVKAVIIFSLLLFVFLIYYNMESTPPNPFNT